MDVRAMPLFDLRETVAIVTGSSRGIGRACVEGLAAAGARVVVSSRTLTDCRTVADELNERYGPDRACAVACDVAQSADIDVLVSSAVDRWGRVDFALAHAAAPMDTTAWIERIDEETMASALVSNVVSATRFVKRLVPIMRANGGGSIVFTSSSAGLVPMEDRLTYGVTKAALIHLAKTLALQLGPLNIRVNTVAPGIVASGGQGTGLWADPELTAAAVGGTPLGRVGLAEEIAGCVVWLASPSGRFATGQTFVIDGGQTLKGAGGVARMHHIIRARRRAALKKET